MNHDQNQFEYIHFMKVLRDELTKSLLEYKLYLGTLDLTVKESDDRLIAVPGTYYKVIGSVIHLDSKRQVKFEKEFLADIVQKTDLDAVLPIVMEIAEDVASHFFGEPAGEVLAIDAKAGSHGIKGIA